ncbi:MAG: carbon-nitrogen family hydrolase [Phycisphaeraceae bacterium]|nr:MAG: carbon-nitrogen family hydrolase [Phycisphaeraceae bacterium]
MNAHLVQIDTAWEDRAENHRRCDAMLERAGVGAGDLVVLPEMFDTGFSFRLERTNDSDRMTLGYLRGLAKRLGATVHGSRTVMGPDGRGRNRATIVGPGGEVLAEYDKVHPFSYGRESEFFGGGDRVGTYPWVGSGVGSGVGTGGSLTVCPAICYDLRFPELFRLGVLRGAEVFALGANWPEPRKHHREALGVARAIENQAYMLCVNRAGSDPHLTYAGGSFAVDPKGAVIARADEGPCVMRVGVDPGLVRAWRAEFPALRDIRLIGDHGRPPVG